MNRRFANAIAFLIAGAIVYVLAIPLMRDVSERRTGCASNLRRAFTACQIYAVQNDQILPDAEHWMDRVATMDAFPFRCDRVEKGYGYAYNDRYSAVPIPHESDAMVLIFDSVKLGRNEHDRVESLPNPGRHDGSNHLVFADGTAQFRKPK